MSNVKGTEPKDQNRQRRLVDKKNPGMAPSRFRPRRSQA